MTTTIETDTSLSTSSYVPGYCSDTSSKLIVEYERNWDEFPSLPEPKPTKKQIPIRNSVFGSNALNSALLRLYSFPVVDRSESFLHINDFEHRWYWQ